MCEFMAILDHKHPLWSARPVRIGYSQFSHRAAVSSIPLSRVFVCKLVCIYV